MYTNKDYFKCKEGITTYSIPDDTKHKANLLLDFQPFPIADWEENEITEENIFDTIEFLFDCIAKPGELVDMVSETGFNYSDYESYNEKKGQEEFIESVNNFLNRYRNGYELTMDGEMGMN